MQLPFFSYRNEPCLCNTKLSLCLSVSPCLSPCYYENVNCPRKLIADLYCLVLNSDEILMIEFDFLFNVSFVYNSKIQNDAGKLIADLDFKGVRKCKANLKFESFEKNLNF